MRSRKPLALAAVVGVAAVVAGYLALRSPATGRIDPADAALVAEGRTVYDRHCASCHGMALQGQFDWRTRKPDGRLPAPPHDASGHTWHHPDEMLFGMVKHGLGPYAPAGYESDMPAYGETLSDRQIWAVLSHIASTWPDQIRRRRETAARQ
ncbi:MAG TPA: c-type cytochrome [Azospirillaceae bacterium]|nr:c-type cytochrome [Azospirillaceae bacterium]